MARGARVKPFCALSLFAYIWNCVHLEYNPEPHASLPAYLELLKTSSRSTQHHEHATLSYMGAATLCAVKEERGAGFPRTPKTRGSPRCSTRGVWSGRKRARTRGCDAHPDARGIIVIIARAHTHTHAHIVHIYVHTHTHVRTYARTHVRTYTRTHARTYARSHTHARRRRRRRRRRVY